MIQDNLRIEFGQVEGGGFQCGHFCLPLGIWCNFTEIDKALKEQLELYCAELLGSLQNKDLCHNYTFWKDKGCGINENRCRGNYPGQCYKISYRINCEYQFGKDCQDKSNVRSSADKIYLCNKGDFHICNDNYTYILKENVCDGYFQCPDGSDEDPNICQVLISPSLISSKIFSTKVAFADFCYYSLWLYILRKRKLVKLYIHFKYITLSYK